MITLGDLEKAVRILKRGGIVVYPTETAYGLAADIMNAAAIKKIFRIKGRPSSKPIPVIAASIIMVKKFFYLNRKEAALAAKHWPGPLTLLLRARKKFPKELTHGAARVAVRVSSSISAVAISALLGRPITATSANISGSLECYSHQCVNKQFRKRKERPDMILEGGTLQKIKPSTIALVEGKKIKVMRKGPIKI